MNFGDSVLIRPLIWKGNDSFGDGCVTASTILGPISVSRDMDVSTLGGDGDIAYLKTWQWNCCVDEYYDENGGEGFSTKAEAKKAATAWYLGRLAPALKAEGGGM